MWQMHDGWGWWMVFGWVWMVIFWGLIIWAVFAVVTRLSHGPTDRTPHDEGTALEILERRYARGELTAEEFEEMRRRLIGGGGPMAKSV
jgi:putative membrane protein